MAARIDPAKAQTRFERCRPINYFLLARNVLLVFSGVSVLTVSLLKYESMTKDLLRMQVAVHVPPCAVATPSSRGILNGLGKRDFSWSPLVVPKTEEVAASKIAASICESSNVYMAISSIMDNSTMIHAVDAGSDPETYTNAENDLVENLCHRRDPEKAIYGEIRQRIATAYVLANPAFRRYHSTGCMGANDPFPTATEGCFYSESVVQVELFRAAHDTLISGYGVLPPVGHMLYRLLVLSAIAEADRRRNDDICFANTLVRNATELCMDIYGTSLGISSVSPPPAAPLDIGGETIPGYEAVVHSLTSCNSLYAHTAAASPPPPPPYPNWNFAEPFNQGMGAFDPVVDACRNIHSFGHFDQQSAFGVPDIVHPFSWKPAHWDWPGGWFYYALSHDKMQGIATLENNPINALKLHNAYRFAVSSAMMVLVGVCCGYWIGFGGTPLVTFAFVRFGEVKSRLTGNYETLLAPRLGEGGLAATFVTLGVWAYAMVLDPWLPAARSYNCDPSCAKWRTASINSVFVTSDHGAGTWEFLVGYFFPFMPIYAFLYSFFCRTWSAPKDEWQGQAAIVQRIPRLEVGLILLQLGSILSFVAISVEDGDLWFDKTIRKRPDSHFVGEADADVLIEDLDITVLIAILGGVACSVSRQRWTIAKLGYLIHFFWCAIIVVCLLLPALLFTIELTTNSERTPRNVSYAFYYFFTAASLCVALAHYLALQKVPGGKVNDKTAVNNNNTVKMASGPGFFARLRSRNQKKDADVAAKQRDNGGEPNPFRNPFRQTARVSPSFASADPDATASLPLLGITLDAEAQRDTAMR
jgi:hypothetical protein